MSHNTCKCGKEGTDIDIIKGWIWVHEPGKGEWFCSRRCARDELDARDRWIPTEEDLERMRE